MRNAGRWSVLVVGFSICMSAAGAAKLQQHPAPSLATSPATDYFTVNPCRVFDSRSSSALVSGTAQTVPVAGSCGVPAAGGANPPVAVALNLTVVKPSADGGLDAFATGTSHVAGQDLLQFRAGQVRANNAVAGLGAASGAIDVLLTTPSAPTTGTANVVVDVVGYFEVDQALPQNDAATVLEDAAATTIDVLANDTAGMTGKTVAAVTQPANGTVVITNAGADLTYQPNANYCNAPPGTTLDTFTYTVTPGGLTASVDVTVTCVNDAPSFTKGADQSVNENAGAQSVLAWATAISPGPANEAGQTVHFNVTGNDNPSLFTVAPAISPSGDLTFTPATDATGSANITITLQDDGGTANGGVDTSAPQTFSISVIAVNQAPSFTKGPDETVLEDAGPQTVSPWATSISPGPPNESGQTVTFNVTGNTNPGLFSAGPAISPTGVLTFTPAANANGTATVTIVLQDNGGTANGGQDTSAPQSFAINVTAVNDAPSFTKGADQTVLEDAGPQTVNGWATAIAAGPANESGQTVHFNVTGNTNAGLFSAAPAISPTGVLTYTPAANANGSATITITLQDDGGTANGGVDTSAPQTFAINVTAVNDAPSFVKGADQSVGDNAGPQTVNPWATAVSAGPSDEAGQTLTFQITAHTDPSIFAAGPAMSAAGVLTYTPAIVPSGTHSSTITLQLQDNGGTANGGVDTSAPQSFTIAITHVNIPPALVASPKENFDTIGNTEFEFAAAATLTTPEVFVAGNLVANFTDSDGPSPLSLSGVPTCADVVAPFDCPTANGGAVHVEANGEFRFTPKAGDTAASDSFQYSITDGSATVNRTVTINRKQRVWYVKNDAPAGGSGRSNDPFDTLVEAQTASSAGDYIFVYRGDGTSTGQAAGITLKDQQHLLGEGAGLSIPVATNGTNPTVLVTPGSSPCGAGPCEPLIDNTGAITIVASPQVGTATLPAEIIGLSLGNSGAPAADVISLLQAAPGYGTSGSCAIKNNIFRQATADSMHLYPTGAGAAITQTFTITGNSWANGGTFVGDGIALLPQSVSAKVVANVSSNTNLQTTTAVKAGLRLDGLAAGLLTITGLADNTVNGASAGTGITSLNPTFDATPGGTFQTVNGGTTVIGASGNGVGQNGLVLANASGDLSFVSLSIFADGGVGLSVTGTGAFNSAGSGMSISAGLNTGPIQAVGGPAVSLSSLSANLQLVGVKSTNSPTTGVSLVNMTDYVSPSSPAIFTGDATSSITNATGTGFNIDGGAATVTWAGTITDTSGHVVSVTNTTGDTKTFSGAIGTGGTGILLNSNTGATIAFTAPITLSTGANAAFTATGGGTVTATDTTSTLTTSTGTALNVANTTIGASGLKFKSISAGTPGTGPTNGIVLNTTGSSGGLTVLGTGSAGSGGTIQHTTGHGISLNSTQSPSFSWMNITNIATSGIFGTNVTNFTLANSVIDGVNTSHTANDSDVAFNANGGSSTENNLSGTVSITNNTINNSYQEGVSIKSFAGTISNLTITGNSLTSSTNATLSFSSAIAVEALRNSGGSNFATITTGTISNNTITNFPGGAGILVFAGISAGTGSAGGNVGSLASPMTINNNTITGAGPGAAGMGTNGIQVTVGNKSDGFFSIGAGAGNTITNVRGDGIACGKFGNNGSIGASKCVIANNTINANNTANSPGINTGADNGVVNSETPTLYLDIHNNTVTNTTGNGILSTIRSVDGTGVFSITNNSVAKPTTSSGTIYGIRVDSGNGGEATGATVCLIINGNTTAGSSNGTITAPGIGLRENHTAPVSTFNISGLSPTPANDAQMEAYVGNAGQNPGSVNGTFGATGVASISSGATFNAATCTIP